MRQLLVGVGLLIVSWSAIADEPAVSTDSNVTAGISSHGLMVELQGFMREQGVDADRLSAEAMVKVMIDWYRFTSPRRGNATGSASDALVYRYGGWSEGCATAFKLSLLRRLTEHDATGVETERLAGITLMFEPSAQAELMPFTAVSSDSKSIEDFLQTIESSPAFKVLASATPMGVLVEGGGLR